mmetsp:Transcript_39741/g.44774  ORF Transcript_39741/g.44774 Transcript_39741/m.44774 type:complete len:210 (-) Transcript_39741:132-761(-)
MEHVREAVCLESHDPVKEVLVVVEVHEGRGGVQFAPFTVTGPVHAPKIHKGIPHEVRRVRVVVDPTSCLPADGFLQRIEGKDPRFRARRRPHEVRADARVDPRLDDCGRVQLLDGHVQRVRVVDPDTAQVDLVRTFLVDSQEVVQVLQKQGPNIPGKARRRITLPHERFSQLVGGSAWPIVAARFFCCCCCLWGFLLLWFYNVLFLWFV